MAEQQPPNPPLLDSQESTSNEADRDSVEEREEDQSQNELIDLEQQQNTGGGEENENVDTKTKYTRTFGASSSRSSRYGNRSRNGKKRKGRSSQESSTSTLLRPTTRKDNTERRQPGAVAAQGRAFGLRRAVRSISSRLSQNRASSTDAGNLNLPHAILVDDAEVVGDIIQEDGVVTDATPVVPRHEQKRF